MTSIKLIENTNRRSLENDVNKFLEGYDNYRTTVGISIFINNGQPNYLALVTILEEIPPVNITGDNSANMNNL
ncbi:MAG TPA: hypothetical protein VH415_11675 [Nitrososphaeraceae archaeon]|jgi:hypothetical protein